MYVSYTHVACSAQIHKPEGLKIRCSTQAQQGNLQMGQ